MFKRCNLCNKQPRHLTKCPIQFIRRHFLWLIKGSGSIKLIELWSNFKEASCRNLKEVSIRIPLRTYLFLIAIKSILMRKYKTQVLIKPRLVHSNKTLIQLKEEIKIQTLKVALLSKPKSLILSRLSIVTVLHLYYAMRMSNFSRKNIKAYHMLRKKWISF